MCEDGLHDPFTDQVECARYRAERDMLAQAMERVADDIERTFLGFEGAEDAPAMRWARQFRAALGSLHAPVRDMTMSAYDLLPEDERDAIAWVRDHGGLDAVKKLLDWVVGHCSTRQQLDFDFWLSGRVMHELGFEEDMADRDEVERRLLARLMPEGIKWPTVDGKPVDFVTGYQPSLGVLEAVSIYSNGACEVMGHDGIIKDVKEIHVAIPKVLDADGVEIRVGDRVWSTHLDEPHEWIVIDPHGDRDDSQTVLVSIGDRTGHARPENLTHRAPVLAADCRPLQEGETVWDTNGDELVIGALENGGHTVTCRYVDVGDAIPVHGMWSPSDLTHERPDSWERLEEDAEKGACDYFGGLPAKGCEGCKRHGMEGNCIIEKSRDIVRRCRALAERERGE